MGEIRNTRFKGDTFRNPGFFDDLVYPAMTTTDPQAAYMAFSAQCPVGRNPDDTVTLTRHADIQFVNQNRAVLGNGHSGAGIVGARRRLIPLDLDGDEHRQWRRRLDPLFAPKQVARLEPNIREQARLLLDRFADRGEVEVFHEWCEPLPASIFLSILGLPQSDLSELLGFMNSQLHPDPTKSRDENMARVKDGTDRCLSYVGAVIDEREAESTPRDDFIGWLITSEIDGERLTRDEVLAVMYLFLLAGLDTVASTLANSLSFLARSPEHRRLVVERPELWPGAVEELMRWDPAIPLGSRKALERLKLPSGEVVEAGTIINVSWPSANLDPRVFESPMKVDFERNPNPHTSFATGFHRCLGSHLARMEIRIALEEFHLRIPDYRLKAGVELEYTHDPRAARHLPLVWN